MSRTGQLITTDYDIGKSFDFQLSMHHNKGFYSGSLMGKLFQNVDLVMLIGEYSVYCDLLGISTIFSSPFMTTPSLLTDTRVYWFPIACDK